MGHSSDLKSELIDSICLLIIMLCRVVTCTASSRHLQSHIWNPECSEIIRQKEHLLQTVQGVKGLLEQAGYTVYNPTLPYHNPMQAWNPTDGVVAVQTYVDVFKKVRALADIGAGDNDRGQHSRESDSRKASSETLCMMADNNTFISMSVIT